MEILVCVKQVPDTEQIRIDAKTNTLIRQGVPSIMNPFDGYALETALRLREQVGGRVTLLSMGPAQAEPMLRGGLAAGADAAFLVSDPNFGGSDTLATGYILGQAVRRLEEREGNAFDVIFCGKQAIDGDTAQVGPELAECLGYTQLTCVTAVLAGQGDDKNLYITRACDSRTETYRTPLPVLLTVAKTSYELRFPNIKGKMQAGKAEIPILTKADIPVAEARIGLAGSPTRVTRTFVPELTKETVIIPGNTPQEQAEQLLYVLKQEMSGIGGNTAGINASDSKAAGPGMLKPHRAALPHEESKTAITSEVQAGAVWVYVELERDLEHSGSRIRRVSLELLAAGRKLADRMQKTLAAVLIGYRTDDAVAELSSYAVDQILVADNRTYAEYYTARYTAALCGLAAQYHPGVLLIGATGNGRDLAPRAACRLQTGLTADCTGIDLDPATQTVRWRRPAFGGNLMADIICPEGRPQMGTVRPGVFAVDLPPAGARPSVIRAEDMDGAAIDVPELLQIISHQSDDQVTLEDAGIIVSAGRGLASAKHLNDVAELARVLGGAVGVSRAVADAGGYDHHHQIGQSGKTVSPDLYIAWGISGAIQHLAGIQGAKTVIAVNRDESAPMVRAADYALIGDALEILPQLIKKIKGE